MNKLTLILPILLAACGSKATAPTTMAAAPSATASPSADPSPGTAVRSRPEIGIWGFDAAGMNAKVAPGTSFYQHANGGWLAATPIGCDPPWPCAA